MGSTDELERYMKMDSAYQGSRLRLSQSPPLRKNQPFEILSIEIDRQCGDTCGGPDSSNIKLLKYNEVPEFLRGNPHVEGGYRAFLPFGLCLKSLFVWSNETINTWSHLLGFIMFFWLMVWDNAIWLPQYGASISDHLVVSIGLLCFQFCLLCSAGYHLFRCHSEKASRRWLALDLAGISVGLLGCYLPGVHYGFYCLSLWRDIYMIIIAVLFAIVFYYQTNPRHYSDQYWNQRVLIYVGLTGYGIIPTIHWIYLNKGFDNPLVQLFAPKVFVVYCLGLLAFAFYITKFPEKYFPGKVDYIGSSHQCWHVVVLATFLWWRYTTHVFLSYRQTHECREDF